MTDIIALLDMDGVVADFTGHCLTHFAPHLKNHEVTDWNLACHWGWDDDQLWAAIDKLGEEFWETIPAYPWHEALWSLAESVGEPLYCSSPSHSALATAGKQRWLQKLHGNKFEGFIFTKHKHLLTSTDTILIDDKDGNVERWNARAASLGHRPAILFPRWWNRKIPAAHEPMAYVAEHLLHGREEAMTVWCNYRKLHQTIWKGQ